MCGTSSCSAMINEALSVPPNDRANGSAPRRLFFFLYDLTASINICNDGDCLKESKNPS